MELEHSEGFLCKHEGCSEKFTTKEYLKDHVRRVHAGEKRYTCQNCRYKTDNKQQMLNHCVKVHGVQPPKKYNCDKCNRERIGEPLSTASGVRDHGLGREADLG